MHEWYCEKVVMYFCC